MKTLKRLILIVATICCLIEVQGVDDYSDSKRPYEFGFTIDGQQHRHEKKDKNGIIMGEFGFITADDVYHVTVYATDENGRFRILSMKNIHLKATPAYRQDKSLTFTSATSSPALPKPTPVQPLPRLSPTTLAQRPQNNFKSVSIEPPANSCSHCSIPTTSTVAPKPAVPTNTQTNINSYNNNPSLFNSPGINGIPSSQGVSSPSLYPGQKNAFGSQTQYPQQVNQRPTYNQQSPSSSIAPYNPRGQNGISFANQNGGLPATTLNSQPQAPGVIPSNNIPSYNSQGKNGITYPTQPVRSRKDKQINQVQVRPSEFNQAQRGQSVPNKKPTLVSAQMQIVDKNTNINYKRPGERDGLPNGVTENDIMNLLYTFNYTLGFQAHYEEGYTNGFKQGYYYVTGRNGVRTRVDYTADNTGFHPKISQDVLDLLSDDVPKPETEKDAKYGLRGYEFKWLYYPVEHKTR